MKRDELRAADPEFAALADMLRANDCEIRVSHYRFYDGRELGRADDELPRTFAVSAESFDAARDHAAWLGRRK